MNDAQNHNPLEHRRLLELAREYRQRGYNVTVNPSPTDLPEDLADCTFDLIAKGKDEVIAVEVRSRETLTLNGPQDLQRMTHRVHQMPGWELELVVTNPRRKAC